MIPDRTVLALMLRGVLSGRRTVALAVLALLPVVVAVATVTADADPGTAWARLVQRLVIPVIVAFVAVVVGAGAVSDQREDGTILYLAATPLRRITLAASAVVAAWAAALAIILPGVVVSYLVAMRGDLQVEALAWPLLAVLPASLAYCAIGALAAMVLRQPVVAAVLYILLWEGTFATWTSTAEYLSVAAYGRAIAVKGIDPVNAPEFGAAAGAAVLVGGAALATAWAARRLTRTELP